VSDFQNFLKKYIRTTSIKSVIFTSKAKAAMLRAKLMTTCTAGIDTSYLTRFTVLLVS